MNEQLPVVSDPIRSAVMQTNSLQGITNSIPESDSDWVHVAADFSTLETATLQSRVPSDHQLTDLLKKYVEKRKALDNLILECDRIHAGIAFHGARSDLVEAYARARDGYEDAVEELGEVREALQQGVSI